MAVITPNTHMITVVSRSGAHPPLTSTQALAVFAAPLEVVLPAGQA